MGLLSMWAGSKRVVKVGQGPRVYECSPWYPTLNKFRKLFLKNNYTSRLYMQN